MTKIDKQDFIQKKFLMAMAALLSVSLFFMGCPIDNGGDDDLDLSGSNGYLKPCYWLNGQRHDLSFTGIAGESGGIAISGSDVYFSGYTAATTTSDEMPCYWLNGVQHTLPIPAAN